MKLRTKTIGVVLATFSVFIVLSYLSLDYLLNRQFTMLEEQRVRQDVGRAAQLLQAKMDTVNATLEDYAFWDETYEFMAHRQPDYVERNWPDTVFSRYRIEALLCLDLSGELVAGKYFDLVAQKQVQLPANITQMVTENRKLWLEQAAAATGRVGIITTASGPVIVAVNPILGNDQKTPARGIMLAVRNIDAELVERLSRATTTPLAIRAADATADSLRDVNVVNEQQISGHYLFRDFYGQPAFMLNSLQGRDINAAGRQSIYYAVSAVMVAGLGVAFILPLLLERFILRRVYSLAGEIDNICQTQNLSATVSLDGKDEIASLAATINEMLSTLAHEKRMRQKALEELQTLNKSLEQHIVDKTYQLQTQFYTDHLTSLPNRFQLVEDLRQKGNPCLAIINIEKFRTINEFYGYQAGDRLLKNFAVFLSRAAQSHNYSVYRLAGDEFVVLADGVSEKLFGDWALSVHDAVESASFDIYGHAHHLFVTVGIAITADNPLEKAQMALNFARQGNLPVQVYHDELPTWGDYHDNLYWINEVQAAMQEERIILHYQPILNLATGAVDKYEVLVRLVDKAGHVVSPANFLPIVKKTKLYPRLTEVILRQAFRFFAERDVEFSINLNAPDIFDSGVRSLIAELMSDTAVAKRVTFEFVESDEFKDSVELALFIADVKRLGGKIAIDDFGSGYSNFAYILKMGADYIKIDGSLIREIAFNPSVVAIVESIVYFARKLNIKTVAEFVSSEAIMATGKKIGMDYVQGYHIGEPRPYLLQQTTIKYPGVEYEI